MIKISRLCAYLIDYEACKELYAGDKSEQDRLDNELRRWFSELNSGEQLMVAYYMYTRARKNYEGAMNDEL